MGGKKRNQLDKINQYLQYFPVVAILGARQVGKTSLSKALRPGWRYFDLEKPTDFERISRDSEFFFQQFSDQIILDEAQEFPKIFSILRSVIDQNRDQCGRFIITGSSSPMILTQISESLAGRVGIIEIGTFRSNEFCERPLSPFFDIFNGADAKKIFAEMRPQSNQNELFDTWLFGGYPEPTIRRLKDAKYFGAWMDSYRDTYLNRDIKKLFPRLNHSKFSTFLSMLSKLSGTIVNRKNLSQSLEISEPTIKEYIEIAQGTFLWRNLTSFEHNVKKEVTKMPKGNFRDSGLLNHLLRIETLDELQTFPDVGKLFETFIIEEILKGIESTFASGWSAHYYRTRNDAEIDLILHGKFGVVPIEIKLGVQTQLRYLQTLKSFVHEHSLPFGILMNNAKNVEWITPEIIQIPVTYI